MNTCNVFLVSLNRNSSLTSWTFSNKNRLLSTDHYIFKMHKKRQQKKDVHAFELLSSVLKKDLKSPDDAWRTCWKNNKETIHIENIQHPITVCSYLWIDKTWFSHSIRTAYHLSYWKGLRHNFAYIRLINEILFVFKKEAWSSLLRSSNLRSSTVSSRESLLLICWSSSHEACLVQIDSVHFQCRTLRFWVFIDWFPSLYRLLI